MCGIICVKVCLEPIIRHMIGDSFLVEQIQAFFFGKILLGYQPFYTGI